LEERLELAKTQTAVIEKQRDRLQKTFREQDAKIQAALRGGAASQSGT
jgi:chaperonin cofactor prefoldin